MYQVRSTYRTRLIFRYLFLLLSILNITIITSLILLTCVFSALLSCYSPSFPYSFFPLYSSLYFVPPIFPWNILSSFFFASLLPSFFLISLPSFLSSLFCSLFSSIVALLLPFTLPYFLFSLPYLPPFFFLSIQLLMPYLPSLLSLIILPVLEVGDGFVEVIATSGDAHLGTTIIIFAATFIA